MKRAFIMVLDSFGIGATEDAERFGDVGADTLGPVYYTHLCDMFEGHAPYKPRYVLPDYARFLANGSEWLELEGAKDLDDALSLLTILYHHVPSVTSMPVYLGQLDALLQPYVRILTQDEIDIRIKRFWRYLDRTLPDAFMHANIGPSDSPITRAILRADAELKLSLIHI